MARPRLLAPHHGPCRSTEHSEDSQVVVYLKSLGANGMVPVHVENGPTLNPKTTTLPGDVQVAADHVARLDAV